MTNHSKAGMKKMRPSTDRLQCAARLTALAWLLLASPAAHPQTSATSAKTDASVLESAGRMTLGPGRGIPQYNYVMTGRIRLLLFWKGADDVGGGYIRRGFSPSDPGVRLIQVLFGSDPAKAPRGINNWGAATEAIGEGYQSFFGFMKSTDTESADDAQAEMQRQRAQGKYGFSAIVAFVDKDRALSRSVPLFSNVDFNLHQIEQAQSLVAARLMESPVLRRLDPALRRCASSRGFLQAVEELIDHALTPAPARASRCYVYNARNYTLTLTERKHVPATEIRVKRKDGTALRANYTNLVRAEFSVLNHKSEESAFELLLGADGALRGVPIRILHRPNFWFEVELNLDSAGGA